MCNLTLPIENGEQKKNQGTNKGLIVAFLSVVIAIPVVVYLVKKPTSSSSEPPNYVWTKTGLERIPWVNWINFTDSKNNESMSHYIKGLPFPGDEFNSEHLEAWQEFVSDSTLQDISKAGFIAETMDDAMKEDQQETSVMFEGYEKVPTLFTDPIILQESPIDYRLQFASDIGSRMIGESAARGRLVNPAGRRLREHFYRFPDQCDATPIALEVFLRLMM